MFAHLGISLLGVSLSLLLGACASQELQIQSNPEGAEVSTLSGESLGKTPLVLKSEVLEKHSSGDVLDLKFISSGRIPRVISMDVKSIRSMSVVLPETSAESFKSEFAIDFSAQLNTMLRRAFLIQKKIGEGKKAEAEAEIQKFNTDYPFAAFGHVISAQLSLMGGKEAEARTHLQRAKILDPADTSIEQSLRMLQGGPR
jgi:hypothetical protein